MPYRVPFDAEEVLSTAFDAFGSVTLMRLLGLCSSSFRASCVTNSVFQLLDSLDNARNAGRQVFVRFYDSTGRQRGLPRQPRVYATVPPLSR